MFRPAHLVLTGIPYLTLAAAKRAGIPTAVYRHGDRDEEAAPQFTEEDLNSLLSPLG